MRRHRAAIVLGVLLCASALLPIPAGAVELSGRLQLAHDAVTARLESVPLRSVIAELARQSGAEVHWADAGGEDIVSARFEQVATADALRRLAPRHNFLLVYRGARLQAIWITSTRPAASAAPAPGTARDDGSRQKPLPQTAEPGPDDPELDLVAQAQQLALESRDVARRGDAMKLLAASDGGSGEARAALQRMAADPGDPQGRALALETLRQIP